MAVTAIIKETLKSALDQANPNKLADALQQVKLGTMLTPLKRTFTGLTSAAAFDLTAIDGVGEDAGEANPNRLPALVVGALRITAGTANAVPCVMADEGGTPTDTATLSVATLSDDGKTVTFGAAVTAFVIEYIPRAGEDMTGFFTRD